MSTASLRTLLLLGLVILGAFLLVSWWQTEPDTSSELDTSTPTAPAPPSDATLRGVDDAARAARGGDASAGPLQRTRIRAVDLRGHPIADLEVTLPQPDRGMRVEAGEDGVRDVFWPASAAPARVLVSAAGYLDGTVRLAPALGPLVVVTLEGDPDVGMRRIVVRATLPDGRYAAGADVTLIAPDERVIERKLDARGELRMDSGTESGTVWPKISVVYRDEHANEYTGVATQVRVPAERALMLTGTDASPRVETVLPLDIPLPKRGHVMFHVVNLASGQSLGGGGRSKQRSRSVRVSMPGRYRGIARIEGRIVAQSDFDVRAGAPTRVVLDAVIPTRVECTLSADLRERFGSMVVCPLSLVKVAGAGSMSRMPLAAALGQDPLANRTVQERAARTNTLTDGVAVVELLEEEDSRVYLLDREGGLLARADATMTRARGDVLPLSLPADAHPRTTCEVELDGDVRMLLGGTDLTVSIWDGLLFRQRMPVRIEKNRLLLPALPAGHYHIHLGMQLEDRYVSPGTPYAIEYPEPPAKGRVRWTILWAR
ncbi:MAG: hypothetical protein P1V36_15205 [Planctomycetota bacterium]|nr:hypothetical protein [Planctomycetota bacterium]